MYPDKESFSVYELLKQDDKKLNVAGHSKIINYIVILIVLINIHRVVNAINLKNQTNYRNLKLLIFLLGFIIANSFLNKILTLETINNVIYYASNTILLILFQFGIWKTYDYS